MNKKILLWHLPTVLTLLVASLAFISNEPLLVFMFVMTLLNLKRMGYAIGLLFDHSIGLLKNPETDNWWRITKFFILYFSGPLLGFIVSLTLVCIGVADLSHDTTDSEFLLDVSGSV